MRGRGSYKTILFLISNQNFLGNNLASLPHSISPTSTRNQHCECREQKTNRNEIKPETTRKPSLSNSDFRWLPITASAYIILYKQVDRPLSRHPFGFRSSASTYIHKSYFNNNARTDRTRTLRGPQKGPLGPLKSPLPVGVNEPFKTIVPVLVFTGPDTRSENLKTTEATCLDYNLAGGVLIRKSTGGNLPFYSCKKKIGKNRSYN